MQRLKARLAASDQEYRAALNGVSIFFGAVLGVALGGMEDLGTLAYITLLLMVTAVVVAILYIPASRNRVAYAVGLIVLLTLVLITHQPGALVAGSFPLPAKLIPTLIVWTGATILVEFGPRERPTKVDP
jgi:MFS-type transporter involved in bile tolerance (Atg22 family)